MAEKFWIGTAHLAMADAMREVGIVAFSYGREAPVQKVSPGDGVIYYAPRTDFEGDPVQAFVALARVTGDEVEQVTIPGTDHVPFARAAHYEQVSHVPVRPLLERLSFVKSPRHWGMAFRRSFFEATPADFALIADGLRGQA